MTAMAKSAANELDWLLSHKPTPMRLPFPLGYVPPSVRPYLELMRLEKPTGTILMFWPFAWSLTMSAFRTCITPRVYSVQMLRCFFAAFIIRSAACTVNDIIDRSMDMGVARTQRRPLPSHRISVSAAVIFLLLQYIAGAAFFYITFSDLALLSALIQLLPLFAIYPFLKRFTHWPQAWLGIAMNFGIITASASSMETVDIPVIVSTLGGCWCWTMLYDTVYACQDIKDDVKVGVRSTAILFGSWIRPLLVGCGVGFSVMLVASGLLNGQGAAYYIISVAGAACHLVWQYKSVDLTCPKSCWTTFKRNGHLGWIVWAGLVLDYMTALRLPAYS